MAKYYLNIPTQLKQQAETWAKQQSVSLNQFILGAISEKMERLESRLDDPQFPHMVYQRGVAGQPIPKIRGTNIRVQTIVIAHRDWGLSHAQITEDYDLNEIQVREAWAFYQAHRDEIDAVIAAEEILEQTRA
ncbi:MAG: hypothetical protein ETSY2_49450 [Candidatus Entotheonella gemina]|uniref:DUF433 domain-containing protein n=1 Tax=Candidatus Entotheonella gemina TaxID=1429439 RepID=W4L9E5_9BACT|nr:MAG: hypothetical protein ETSY2_49450 [Candidatus Entotheonella gemina]